MSKQRISILSKIAPFWGKQQMLADQIDLDRGNNQVKGLKIMLPIKLLNTFKMMQIVTSLNISINLHMVKRWNDSLWLFSLPRQSRFDKRMVECFLQNCIKKSLALSSVFISSNVWIINLERFNLQRADNNFFCKAFERFH